MIKLINSLCFCLTILILPVAADANDLHRMKYNHPGLKVDLGVGLWAWPLPVDYDGDGDNDLVVVCPDVPFKGAWFFENPDGSAFPAFKPPVRIGPGPRNIQVSYVDGQPRVLGPGLEYTDFLSKQFTARRRLPLKNNIHPNRVRANQWKYADYDGDGLLDLIVGVGDWTEYGWDNAFDKEGNWTRGPLRGFVYWLRNTGTKSKPSHADPVKIHANGQPIDVYGMPSPNLADFDGDGDLDIICGEFLDKFTYFQNVGSRTSPEYAAGVRLTKDGQPIQMDLQMIVPTAIDWDKDGDIDLIVGDEDGRVAFVEHSGKIENGTPIFLSPKYFQQTADEVKFGALVTPVSVDWDADGDEDLICGNTAGHIGFIENLDGGNPPRWAAPKLLTHDDQPIRIQAGPNGSIQGPCEAKWGYTTLSVADWDHDGRLDVIANSIWGKVVWFRNTGQPSSPRLAGPQPIEVSWESTPPKPEWNWWNPKPGELSTQWRTTPCVYDWNQDGLYDLIMLDHEGYLTLYPREKTNGDLRLKPPRRMFYAEGVSGFDSKHRIKRRGDGLLQLNVNQAGGSGRRKFCITDWDGDGRPDLLVNSRNVTFLRNVKDAPDGGVVFREIGPVHGMTLAGHTTSPTVVDWDRNGVPDMLIGAEDGFFYYLPNPRKAEADIREYLRRKSERIAEKSLAGIETLDAWKKRRPSLKRQLLEMLGLWPMPEKTDLKATATGTIERDDIVVEKLHFQSMPGLYVTANFYRPKVVDGKLPTILYVCGHSRQKYNGVSYGNKVGYQHHPTWFAQHGYCCLIIDSLQLGEIEGLHHGTYRHNMWWWQARGYTPAGVEAWNCIRALDYLETRPEVDMGKIGVTGRSGGGICTWWTAALDDRPACLAPVAGITDMRNYVVDGCIEGHCDCMFMVNHYGWDFDMVAALAAPRPLLFANSDKDSIFPLDGVMRTHTNLKKIYDLYDATDKLGLLITEGPHKDTQDLRVPAFRWMNRWLKGNEDVVDRPAEKLFSPQQLKVLDKLPSDERNTRIHEDFVNRNIPALPSSATEWENMKAGLLNEIARTSFRSRPVGSAPPDVRVLRTQKQDEVVIRMLDYSSEENLRLPMVLIRTAGAGEGGPLIVVVADDETWEDRFRLGERTSWKLVPTHGQTIAIVPPRGVGPTKVTSNNRELIHMRRRFALLGETMEEGQVWDVLRAIAALRTMPEFKKSSVWLKGRGKQAGVALYAGLYEPNVERFELHSPTTSHRDGPIFLNIMKILDMPQAVALALPRKVSIVETNPAAWEWTRDVANLYPNEQPFLIRQTPGRDPQ